MKKQIAFLGMFFNVLLLFAQSPQSFQYQAVVRDNSGVAMPTQNVGFQLSIISGSPTGTVEYVETHSAITNAFGVVTLSVGTGTTTDNFLNINWGSATHFLKVETDLGSGYVDMGTTQLLSVPYALYAETSGNTDTLWNLNGNNIYNSNQGNVGVGINNPIGRMVVQGDSTASPSDPLFEVKNSLGQSVFVVWQDSVQVYINDDAIQSNRGGFAVSGRNTAKAFTNNYLKVTPDSSRIWTKDTLKGFGVENINGTTKTSYMKINPDNYFIGHEAGKSITSGKYNSFIGYQSGFNNLSGNKNYFIGYRSGYSNEYGNSNILIGDSAGFSNIAGENNVMIGNLCGKNNVYGNYNVFLGNKSGFANDASHNVFIGYESGFSNTLGAYNCAIGYNVFHSNTIGLFNTATGYQALFSNTIGSANVAIGESALFSNTDGQVNVAIGRDALYSNVTGHFNVAVGDQSLYSSTTSDNNCAIGFHSMHLTTGSRNSAFGTGSLGNNTTGDDNTALGHSCMNSSINGYWNVAVGGQAMYLTTSGYSNTAVGYSSLMNNTDGYGNTSLGYLAYLNGSSYNNSTALGANSVITASNQVSLGDNAVTSLYCMGAYIGTVGVTNRDIYVDNNGKIGYISSSLRYKNNVTNMENINWLYQLRPVNYTYIKDSLNKKQYGFIAEEVEKINPLFVSYNRDGTVETVNYSNFISPIIKALQVQKEINDEQKTQINFLLKENESLKSDNHQFKQKTREIDQLKVEIEQLKSLFNSSAKK